MCFPSHLLLLLVFITALLFAVNSNAAEFVFNTNFNSSNLILVGTSTIQSSIISLANTTYGYRAGRAFYSSKLATRTAANSSTLLPFSTSFIFDGGSEFAFLFLPVSEIHDSRPNGFLGISDITKSFLSFQFLRYPNVVRIAVKTAMPIAQHLIGYWNQTDPHLVELSLEDGANYQAWIDFFDSRINVTIAPAGSERPSRPFLTTFANLSTVLQDQVYVGFSAAQNYASTRILSWSFSNTNFSIADALITEDLPSFPAPPPPIYEYWPSESKRSVFSSKWFLVGVSTAGVLLLVFAFLVVRYWILARTKKKKLLEKTESWELDYWPHRIDYQAISTATESFSEKNIIGSGGSGKVFKGVLPGGGGEEVAVKMISLENELGMREFLAEVSSLGRLKHRNLVGLKGWCKINHKLAFLVYDYMGNGSLDTKIFGIGELSWKERVKVLEDVAHGILYLHQGWESEVLHRDIKPSNVLLDNDMTAKLGDFGLARMHRHGQSAHTTGLVGTLGYMAPEFVKTGRASTRTDVFSFGVLVLEVVCGRRCVERGSCGLVDRVRRVMMESERDSVVEGLEEVRPQESDAKEFEKMVILGLWCASPESGERPTMREVVRVFAEEDGVDEKMESINSKSRWCLQGRDDSAFEEIRHSLFSHVSLAESDFIRHGR